MVHDGMRVARIRPPHRTPPPAVAGSDAWLLRCSSPWPRAEMPRAPIPVAFALVVLAVLATLAPEQAVAQSEITLVGNAGQPTGERQTASFQGAVDHAQQFTTGTNTAGYTLTKVEFLSKDAQSHTFSAQLCEANNTGEGAVPDPMNCQTLSTTSSFAQDSVVVFTPPMPITLAASTRYVVVLSENNSPSAQVEIFATQADNQSGATGWTLANVFDWKQNGTTWMKQGIGRDALVMDVKGYAAGICSRTQQVRVAILAKISGVTDCALVTNEHLAAITGSLFLRNQGITGLQSGDFAGLTAVTDLNLNLNTNLGSLPAGVFDNLTALTTLSLGSNGLTALPAGVFDDLTALTTLELEGNGLTALRDGVFDNLTVADDAVAGEQRPDRAARRGVRQPHRADDAVSDEQWPDRAARRGVRRPHRADGAASQ